MRSKTMFRSIWMSIFLYCLSSSVLNAQTLCSELTLGTNVSNVSCFGANNGSITITPNGGTGPYNYSWSNGATTPTINNLAPGTYTVTVTDNSCNPSGVELVTNGNFNSGNTGFSSAYNYCSASNCLQPEGRYAIGTSASYYHTNFQGSGYGGSGRFMIVNGHGTPNTSVWCQTVNVQPNTNYVFWTWVTSVNPVSPAQLQFSINGVQLGNIFSAPLPVGTWSQFYITWNSGNNTTANICIVNQNTIALGNDFGLDGITFQKCTPCTKTATITITQPSAALNASISSSTNVNCFGASTGSATVTATGGTAPYTYLWTNGATTATANNLPAGTHSVTVTDSKGCKITKSVTITQPSSALNGSITASTNVNCFGASTGSATVTPTGGTSPYTYLWSNGATTATANNLPAGTHTVTITDNKGCTKQVTVTITQPSSALNGSITASTNVNCFGASTGSATVTPTGGTSPYTYLWSSGATTATANNLPAGTHTVTITDNKGCTKQVTVTITQPASALNGSITASTNVNCFGASTGSATVTPTGGTAPYTYLWSNGATTATANNLVAGTYTVTITDNKGCTKQVTVTITQPSSALNGSITASTNVNCFGASTGSATVTPTGGTSPYTYVWSSGATTATANNLPAGTHTVTVTDDKGCTKQVTVTITQPSSALNGSITASTNVNCFGENTGSATVTPTGGTSPYTYVWSNGATTATANNLPAGTHTVTITDNKGCTKQVTVTITQPASALNASITASTNVNCFGENTGSATVTPTGGTAPYTYLWSNGATTASANNLIAGTYTVTVTDNKGCTKQVTVTITQPASRLNSSITSSTNVNCFGGNTGAATVTASGGTAPYTYLWNNGATTASIINLTAGTYTVTITDDKGCTTTQSVTITQPAAALTASITSSTNVNCFGGNTGAATVTASGGTAPYTYLWNNGATTASIINLTAGTYTVTITDNKGCITTQSVTITQPAAALTASITSSTNVNCFGENTGAATVTASDGTAPYTYLWSNGATTASITNLVAGTYNVTITDNKGCTTTQSVTITQPSHGLTSSISSSSNVNCFGGNTGAATVTVNGGTLPYVYAWSNGASTASITNLTAGTYTVVITDGKGCTTTQSVTITQPAAALSASISSSTNVNCFGGNTGAATLTVTGGTAPYTYLWSNGATTASLTNLVAGTYTVNITDDKGCTTTQSVTITQPAAALTASITSSTNVNCFGGNTGAATVTASGGTAPYTYLWSNGATTASLTNLIAGTYTVNITDDKGCTTTQSVTITQPAAALAASISSSTNVNCFGDNTGAATVSVTGGTTPYTYLWSNGATTASLTNLIAGTYTVNITDDKGCTTTQSVTITQPAATLTTSISASTDVNCYGAATGAATVTPAGGTIPYMYEWSNGTSSQTATNLVAGTYTVEVTDSKGCTATQSVTINQADALDLNSLTHHNISCFNSNDGSVELHPAGGTLPYAYAWSNGATTSMIQNLAPGSYSVNVTDVNNCSIQQTFQVTEPALLNTTAAQVDPVQCFGMQNGAIQAQTTGGTLPYTYQWNTGATVSSINNLAAGTYILTTLDANFCPSVDTFYVQMPQDINITTNTIQHVSCNGLFDGNVSVNVTGGNGGYAYQWSNGGTANTIQNLAPGTYTLYVQDSKGCLDTFVTAITQPAPVALSNLILDDATCNGSQDASIEVIPTGGTFPYTYAWSNGATTSLIQHLTPGTYSVQVLDANLCLWADTFVVAEPALLNTIANQIDPVQCFGMQNGAIQAQTTGGTLPYTYQWNTGATTSSINNLADGTYILHTLDANNCAASDTFVVSMPQDINILTNTLEQVSCNGADNGSIAVNVTGGNGGYVYQWSNGMTTSQIQNLAPGTYTLHLQDSKGCEDSLTAIITEPAVLAWSNLQLQDVNCNGNANASIEVTPTGGTFPYTYQWDNGATTSMIQNLAPGTYVVTMTDSNNCALVDSFDVTEPTVLNTTAAQVDPVQCFGLQNGSIQVQPSGGTIPYTYQWSNGQTIPNINGLDAGTYILHTYDANNCLNVDTFQVQMPADMDILATTDQEISCHGTGDGSISTVVTGGNGGYTYQWSDGSNLPVIQGLGGGTYYLLVTDSKGCQDSIAHTLVEPDSLIAASLTSVNATCSGFNNGTATIQPMGGTAPYNFQWSNTDNDSTATNLMAGTYWVTVVDARNCTYVDSVEILEPAVLAISNALVDGEKCAGDENGSIDLTITGGTAPYVIQWNNGDNGPSLQDLAPGIYSYSILDSNQCPALTGDINIQDGNVVIPPQIWVSGSGHLCNGETALLQSGNTPFDILWSNGDTQSDITVQTPGIYFVTATDSIGCSAISDTLTITASQVEVAIQAPSISCAGEPFILEASGAESYIWSNGEMDPEIEYTTNVSGNITVWGFDSMGCQDSASFYVTLYEFTVAENDSLEVGFNQEGYVIVLDNDSNAQGVTIIVPPLHGTADINGNTITYQPQQGFTGEDSLVYITCHPFCNQCDTAVVKFKVAEDPTIFIPEVITPNMDGKNDYFEIKGLENYPENSLVILNRWGDVIYTAEPYKNDWDGISNFGMTAVNTQVTNSVYYYVLKLTPTSDPVRGFVEVKK